MRSVRVVQILLNLARSIFEEQNNLECLVTKIMTEARDLLKCERCAVFLLDTECCEAVSYDHHNIFRIPTQTAITGSLIETVMRLCCILVQPGLILG
jgi:hypothetical protein